MIQIKGMTICDTIDRAKSKYGEKGYNKIIDQLSEDNKKIYSKRVILSLWYPIDALIEFLEIENNLYDGGNKKMVEKHSTEVIDKELKGIYKLFIKFGSPEFVVSRIGSVNNSYFKGITLEVKTNGNGKYIGRYTGFEKHHEIFQYSITAFYKRALEISGAKDITAMFTTPMSSNLGYSEITVTWKK